MDRRTDRQTDGWIEKDPNSDDQTDGHIEVGGRIDKSVDYMFFLLGALCVKVSGNCQCLGLWTMLLSNAPIAIYQISVNIATCTCR